MPPLGRARVNRRSPRRSGRRSPPGAGVVALDQALRLKTFQALVRRRPLRRHHLRDRRRSISRRRLQELEDRLFDLSRRSAFGWLDCGRFAPGRLAGVGFLLVPPAPFNNSRLMASRVKSSSPDRRTNRCASSTKFPLIIAFPPAFKSPPGLKRFNPRSGQGMIGALRIRARPEPPDGESRQRRVSGRCSGPAASRSRLAARRRFRPR
jgi:hypothetical protein